MFKSSSLVSKKFITCDWKTLAGEECDKEVIRIAKYLADASQANGSTEEQKEKLFFITEGRHNFKGYSACADLAHCVISLMGIKNKKLLNRDDDNSNGIIDQQENLTKWAPGKNISMLVWGSRELEKSLNRQMFVDGKDESEPIPGSIVIIGGTGLGGPEHVFICTDIDDRTIYSVDAGQVDSGGQCVKNRVRKLYRNAGRWWVKSSDSVNGPAAAGSGGRAILGWIDVGILAELSESTGYRLADD